MIFNFNDRKNIILSEEQIYLLYEAVADINDIYEKYYRTIPKNIFFEIVAADPTYKFEKPNKIGKYAKWLLKLYANNNLELDNLQQVRSLLQIFHENKKNLKDNDINKYHTLDELSDALEQFQDGDVYFTKSQREKQIKAKEADIIYNDDEWEIIVPKTWEASKLYGAHTKWCTASKESSNYFDDYNSKGKLYINIDKRNNNKYQFHFETNSFMDEEDAEIEDPIAESIDMPQKVIDFYTKLGKKQSILAVKVQKNLLTDGDNTISREVYLSQNENKSAYAFFSDNEQLTPYLYTSYIVYNDLILLQHADDENFYDSYIFNYEENKLILYIQNVITFELIGYNETLLALLSDDDYFNIYSISNDYHGNQFSMNNVASYSPIGDYRSNGRNDNYYIISYNNGSQDLLTLFPSIYIIAEDILPLDGQEFIYYDNKTDSITLKTKDDGIITIDSENNIEYMNESKILPNVKSIYLTENQLKILLKERMSNIVYHFTSISNVLRMAEENKIYLQSALEGFSNTSKTNKLFYLSTTRTKYQSFGYSRKFTNNSARIELDGDALNYVMKGQPYNYFNGSLFDNGKQYYLADTNGLTKDKQEHVRDEAEDRLFSDKSYIPNARNVIRRIDIIITDISDKENPNYLNVYNLLMSHFSQITYVYDNLNDFNKQSDNTINKKFTEDYEKYGYGTYNRDSYTFDFSTVQAVLALIFFNETNNLKEDAAKLLKQYGLEELLHKGILKNIEQYHDYPYSGDIYRLIEKVSYGLSSFSRKPNNIKSKVLQMLSDYFKKHKLRNYKDLVKYKITNSNRMQNVSYLIKQGLIDDTKSIDAYTIRNYETWNEILITDFSLIRVKDVNDDLETVAELFISYTEENMKSDTYSSYERYIKRIINSNPTLQTLIDMLYKLGYQDNYIDILGNVLNTSLRQRSINVYSYSDDLIMPQTLHNGDKSKNQAYFLSLFKKE